MVVILKCYLGQWFSNVAGHWNYLENFKNLPNGYALNLDSKSSLGQKNWRNNIVWLTSSWTFWREWKSKLHVLNSAFSSKLRSSDRTCIWRQMSGWREVCSVGDIPPTSMCSLGSCNRTKCSRILQDIAASTMEYVPREHFQWLQCEAL